ncbi:hypothetical protein SAMN02910368_02594 [Lachnospiraceae bacterium G11]|nr:hypothetical protein SAMN02910368_02594 [Lachnospiraceae bacterium G11]
MSIEKTIEEVSESQEDNIEAFQDAIFYYLLCVGILISSVVVSINITFDISYPWSGDITLETLFEITFSVVLTLLIGVPLYRGMEREYQIFYNDVANVARRLIRYYDKKTGRFKLADAPLFFMESVASQYKPPTVIESEKMLLRRNSFGVLVVIPVICAVITSGISLFQSSEESTFRNFYVIFWEHYGDIFIIFNIVLIIGLIIRIVCLPTSYNKRSKVYKIVLCAYPFISKELERRYNCIDISGGAINPSNKK